MTIDEAVKNSGFKNPFDGGSRKYAQQLLLSDETLLFAYNCNFSIVPSYTQLDPGKVLSIDQKLCGVFVVTDKRIFICNKVLANNQFKEIVLNKIQSMDEAGDAIKGLAQLRIKGLTEMFILDLNRSQKKHIDELKGIIHSAMQKQNADVSQPVATIITHEVSEADELAKFKKLLDDGVITQEEFDLKKKQILGL